MDTHSPVDFLPLSPATLFAVSAPSSNTAFGSLPCCNASKAKAACLTREILPPPPPPPPPSSPPLDDTELVEENDLEDDGRVGGGGVDSTVGRFLDEPGFGESDGDGDIDGEVLSPSVGGVCKTGRVIAW